MKNVGVVRNELSRLEAFPPANRAAPSECDGNNIKWKGLTILQRKGKMPRIVKGEAMQACSSRKTKLVELSDERRCEVVDLECDNCEKEICETEKSASSNCFNTMGLIKKRKVPESQGSASSSLSKEKGSGGGDNKQASASAFLSQVRSHHPHLFMFQSFLYIKIFGSHATSDLNYRSKKSSMQKNITSSLGTCKH